MPRPNLVIFMTDEQRFDTLGHAVVRTPHLDRLCREGTPPRNAFTVSPLCTPSRTRFFTGNYPHVNRSLYNHEQDHLTPGQCNFLRALKDAGQALRAVARLRLARRGLATYYGQITFCDDQVGRMLAELERTGKLDDTPILFTSGFGGRFGLTGKTAGFNDTLVSIPAILRRPGAAAGKTLEAHVVSRIEMHGRLTGWLAAARAVAGVPPRGRPHALTPVIARKSAAGIARSHGSPVSARRQLAAHHWLA